MTAAVFFGCTLGPAIALFLFTIVREPLRVIFLIAGGLASLTERTHRGLASLTDLRYIPYESAVVIPTHRDFESQADPLLDIPIECADSPQVIEDAPECEPECIRTRLAKELWEKVQGFKITYKPKSIPIKLISKAIAKELVNRMFEVDWGWLLESKQIEDFDIDYNVATHLRSLRKHRSVNRSVKQCVSKGVVGMSLAFKLWCMMW
ncbi:Gamma-secretase subunit Aph-1b [Liparis tanakae]|uniref:Gamma-secretase subunit APH-1 n=1 Tax=Liparis tanakae TaxID=230148 RepID=A0A4Z2ES84_9TELE|nr:Gamma-secretase subunit Aph-1b [Liparis tanakae]